MNLVQQINNTKTLPNSLSIWWLGQMGMVIKGSDAVLYIDPCLTNDVAERHGDWWERAFPPPILPEEVTNADFCLITHEHGDHFDKATIAPMAKASPQAKFVAPRWCKPKFQDIGLERSRYILPKALETSYLPKSKIRITPVPSAHYDLGFDEEKGYRWYGYLVEWNGVKIYHAGDTIIYPRYVDTLKQLPKADIAVLPVNGRDWYREQEHDVTGNLHPKEAAQLAAEMNWELLLIGHNDLYVNNKIPNSEIVAALDKYASNQAFKMMKAGELLYFVKH
ncbi:MAG: MBL fold metallo-hydrolase [Bacteroidota bacterium]